MIQILHLSLFYFILHLQNYSADLIKITTLLLLLKASKLLLMLFDKKLAAFEIIGFTPVPDGCLKYYSFWRLQFALLPFAAVPFA